MDITKESLLEYGMKEYDNILFPMQKTLAEDDAGRVLAICATPMRNQTDICLLLPNSTIIYLAVNSIEELQAFENCIESVEEN